MSDGYKITDNCRAFFVTLTITAWIDVFSRKEQKLLFADSLNYCVKNKGLVIYGYCIMTNHVHLICSSERGSLSDVLRDLKSFTSKQITGLIMSEGESRKSWMLNLFKDACDHLKRKQHFKVWQDGNQAKEIYSNSFLYEKLEYIHTNPVKALIVEKPEEYLFSSARDYSGLKSYVDVFLLDHKPLTVHRR